MLRSDLFNNNGGIACNNGIGFHILRHDGAGAHHGILANNDAAKNSCIAPNRRAIMHKGLHHLPVSSGLEFPRLIGGAWKKIVGKHDAVPYKHAIGNMYAFANEGVARDLTVSSNSRPLLYLHKTSHLAIVADAAFIGIHEIEDAYIAAHSHLAEVLPVIVNIDDFHISQF